MTFQSVEYLIFFPIVFLLYWTLCSKSKTHQNALLVLSSMVFYGWWDCRFLGLLLLTAVSTFLAGRLIAQTDNRQRRKWLFVGVVVLNLGILFCFKYFGFFVHALADALALFGISAGISSLRILLPVGISFYTFSALSYTIDIFQRKVKPTDDLLAYLAYVMFFPSILSGPISRAQKQLPQYLLLRRFDYDHAVYGCKCALMGAVIKLVVADRLGIFVDAVYANICQHNGTTLLVASILYSFQIYADFAGYSLMAIGSGRLLGIELPDNFKRPYFAKTVTDFWRRWHISLTTWFRDYLYFPLGGNRCKKSRWMLNTMIVFTVSGLWHGAAYTFVVWGALHGACMVAERLLYGEKIKAITDKFTLPNVVRMLFTFAIVTFAWIFFRAETLGDAVEVIRRIFTMHGSIGLDFSHLNTLAIVFLLVYDFIKEKRLNIHFLSSKYMFVRYATSVMLILLILTLGVLNGGSFIYFKF